MRLEGVLCTLPPRRRMYAGVNPIPKCTASYYFLSLPVISQKKENLSINDNTHSSHMASNGFLLMSSSAVVKMRFQGRPLATF